MYEIDGVPASATIYSCGKQHRSGSFFSISNPNALMEMEFLVQISRQITLVGAASLAVVLATSGFALAAPQVTEVKEDTSQNILRMPTGGGGTIDSLNPFILLNQASVDITQIQYESLAIQQAPSGVMGPDLAEKWTTEGDTWTFTLRPDLKWSDGEPLTAEDVSWTYNTVMTKPELALTSGSVVENIVSVKALDASTVEIVTTEPQAINPGNLWIVPKHIWSVLPDPAAYENTKDVVGSGPFVLTEYSRGVSAHMVANPNNWRGAPKLDGLDIINYKNKDAAVLALRAGEIDMVGRLTAAQYDSFAGDRNITQVSGDPARYLGMSMNHGTTTVDGTAIGDGAEALKDVKVRRAIRQALDVDQIVEKVLGGHGVIGPEILATGTQPYYSDYADIAQGYDPAAANKALDEAGYPLGADGYRVDKSGKTINLRLAFDGSNNENTLTAQFIEPWLKEIGIAVTSKPVSIDQRSQDAGAGNYDLYLTGWGNPIDPDYLLYINTCATRPTAADGSGNASADLWCDPEFDKLYAAQHVELDLDKRVELVRDALTIHYEAAVLANLYYPVPLLAYRSDRVANLMENVIQGDFTNYQQFHNVMLVGQEDPSGAAGSGDEPNWLLIGGISVVVLLLVAGGVTMVVRRRKTATDRE